MATTKHEWTIERLPKLDLRIRINKRRLWRTAVGLWLIRLGARVARMRLVVGDGPAPNTCTSAQRAASSPESQEATT